MIGKVLVTAKIENALDLFDVQQGLLKPEQVRSIEVTDALADTSVLPLSLPKRLIERLGLQPAQTREWRDRGSASQVYGLVRLTVQGRDWRGDVAEIADEYPIVIGRLPLLFLDFVVDPQSQRLIGNPAHGGEQMLELY